MANGRTVPREIFVSPQGRDDWSGNSPEPNAQGTDGPLETVAVAQRIVRDSISRTTDIDVVLRGGTYELGEPLIFGPEDSARAPRDVPEGSPALDPQRWITYRAYRDERPVISGGRRITDWAVETRNSRTVWVTRLDHGREAPSLRQMWVNGELRSRSRLPRDGFFRITRVPDVTPETPYAEGQMRFVDPENDDFRLQYDSPAFALRFRSLDLSCVGPRHG